MNPRRLRPVATLLLLFSLVLASGCRALKPVTSAVVPSSKGGSGLSEAELREKLAAFYIQFINAFETATVTAAARSEDPALREKLVAGRLRAVRTCRQAIFQREPMAAFVDTWSACIQLDLYFGAPEGRAMLGEALPLVHEAVRKIRTDIEAMGSLLLKTNQLAEAKQKLEDFARAHPFAGQSAVKFPSGDDAVKMPELGWLFSIPLSPFRVLEGVDQTAQAVHELAFVARGFEQTASDLPRELAWQSELLLLQARREMGGLIDDIDRKQTNTQATLQQVRGALTEASNLVARFDPALAGAEKTLKAVAEASGAVDATLKTYTQMIKDLYPPKTEEEKARQAQQPKGRPFDILDYAKTADGITASASELKQVLIEFQRTLGTNTVSVRLEEIASSAQNTISHTEASTRRLANHLAWRAVLVIIVFFAALLVYRVTALAVQKKLSANQQLHIKP